MDFGWDFNPGQSGQKFRAKKKFHRGGSWILVGIIMVVRRNESVESPLIFIAFPGERNIFACSTRQIYP
jgi:hypothetical protein